MLLYRVHPWDGRAGVREPFGALYFPLGQGYGRWDNPHLYRLGYFSLSAAGAVAETFGSLARWREEMFLVPDSPDITKALSIYTLSDQIRLADLSDPEVLTGLGIRRVTDVVERNLPRTQRLAAQIFESGDWDGIQWWSYYHPSIQLAAIWSEDEIGWQDTVPLGIGDEVVAEAATLIVRTILDPKTHRD